MKLYAISDLHLAHRDNREALDALSAHPDDWVIVAGDVGERAEHLTLALEVLGARFAHVIWTPGNHDLWCPPDAGDRTRGQARYDELVGICRRFGVTTPEELAASDYQPDWVFEDISDLLNHWKGLTTDYTDVTDKRLKSV